MSAKLELCALASGSNGNCYYVGNEREALLVDAGLSARILQLRMAERGLQQSKIKAILITHEHNDHCRGARVLAKRLGIPVYVTKKTFLALSGREQPRQVVWFEPDVPVSIGEFEVFPFSKQHDAAEACSFRIRYEDRQVGVMTDIGEACDRVKAHFAQCHAVFLETNYDEQMLWDGPYPYYLKQRIASGYGHLSNTQACRLVESFAGSKLEIILLSHLSKENNTPEKAMEAFKDLQVSYHIEVTSRYEPGKVLYL